MDNKQLEQNQQESKMSLIGKVAVIGFIGGVFWSFIGYLAHALNFTKISPNVILEPWMKGKWIHHWRGFIITLLLLGVISIGVAFLYYICCRNIKSMWAGATFGIVLLLIVVFLFHPLFPGIRPIKELHTNTLITTICLYLLYGVFVGYSISYEQNEFH